MAFLDEICGDFQSSAVTFIGDFNVWHAELSGLLNDALDVLLLSILEAYNDFDLL